MRSWSGRALAAVITVVAVFSITGCSDDEAANETTVVTIARGDAPLRIEQIADAITAVEAELGGEQRYFEVNATPTLVNVFVAVDGGTAAVSYVFAAGKLTDPTLPQPAAGATFAASDIEFDESKILAAVVAELPDSNFRVFSVLGADTGGARYQVTIESSKGAMLEVPVAADGTVLGVNG